jgi:hypothetical protein
MDAFAPMPDDGDAMDIKDHPPAAHIVPESAPNFVPAPANVPPGTDIDPRDHPDTEEYFAKIFRETWCSESQVDILYSALDKSAVQVRDVFIVLLRAVGISPPIKRLWGWLLVEKLLDIKGPVEFSQTARGANQFCYVGPPGHERRMIFRAMLLYISPVSQYAVGTHSLVKSYADGRNRINILRMRWQSLGDKQTALTEDEQQTLEFLQVIFTFPTFPTFPPRSEYGPKFGPVLANLVYGARTKWVDLTSHLRRTGGMPDLIVPVSHR